MSGLAPRLVCLACYRVTHKAAIITACDEQVATKKMLQADDDSNLSYKLCSAGEYMFEVWDAFGYDHELCQGPTYYLSIALPFELL